MVLNPAILILTNRLDFSTDWIIRKLKHRKIEALRLNTETIHTWKWEIDPVRGSWRFEQEGGRHVSLSDLRAVYYRRPERPRLTGLSRADSTLSAGQWQALIDGLGAIPDVRWVSPPHQIDAAESKLRQLYRARELGFAVAETMITNSRSAAVEFMGRVGDRAVVKGLSAPILGPAGRPAFVFTTEVRRDDLDDLADPDPAPFILQRLLRPKVDVRVTVVGAKAMAAITSSTALDWRTQDPSPSFRPCELSPGLSAKCVALVASFGLRFGGIDLAIVKDESYFLELNPNGEWGWLQHAGLPIAEAIVDELVGGGT